MRITLAQLNPLVGDIQGNTQRLLTEWEKGNLILVFDGEAESMIAAQPGQFLFRLTNDSRGLAPELEEHLEQNGIGVHFI
jgi:hypothetical protein